MKKIIGILLIVLAVYTGYVGVNKVSNSGESVEVIGIELSASDEGKKRTGYIYLGGAVLFFIGGSVLVGKKN